MDPSNHKYSNRILAALSKVDRDRIAPHLSPVTLKLNTELMDGTGASYAYFLESGLASHIVEMADGTTVEVGVVGKDGVVGLPLLLGADGMPGRTFIQVEATGYRINAQHLREEVDRSTALQRHLQKYLLGHLVESAQFAACNRLHGISERLARWLLTCHDRVESDRIPLTHDFLGQMLGAERSTVTLAAGMLHQAGLIDYARGHVTITNRPGLEDVSCECYHVVRDEFQRLGLR